MNTQKQLIASVLEEIAAEAGVPRPMADATWRAGRRRRLTALAGSALASGTAIAAALLLLPLTGGGAAPQTRTASIALRTPVQLRQVARIGRGRCPAHSRGVPGSLPGPRVPACYHLTGRGLTITMVKSAYVTKTAPGEFLVDLRLTTADTRRFAALTGQIFRLHPPRDQLAVIVHGRVINAPIVIERIGSGIAQIYVLGRPQGETLLHELIGR